MLIELRDVAYQYAPPPHGSARPPALAGVSMGVAGGSAVALLGSSGSGRSTLLALVNGLLKPSAGHVLVEGVDVAAGGTDTALLRRRVGLLMQNADDQLFGATVLTDVGFGPTQMSVPAAEIQERVREALESVGLAPDAFGARSPFSLSGGQRRRVAIAGILAMRPLVLALDEPLAGLDPEGKQHLLEMLADLRRQRGLTILMATKDVAAALRFADHFVVLHEGRVVLDGGRPELVAGLPRLADLGLELPTQSTVLLALRERGWAVPPLADDLDQATRSIMTAGRQTDRVV
ncbi:MAG: energy-coupling factor ABC transporter ATP-binding protein [Chloroflexota bacterium]